MDAQERYMRSGAVLMTNVEPSVEDFAALLGALRNSVYRWIEERGLPAYKIGRLWGSERSLVDTGVRAGGADVQDGCDHENGGL